MQNLRFGLERGDGKPFHSPIGEAPTDINNPEMNAGKLRSYNDGVNVDLMHQQKFPHFFETQSVFTELGAPYYAIDHETGRLAGGGWSFLRAVLRLELPANRE